MLKLKIKLFEDFSSLKNKYFVILFTPFLTMVKKSPETISGQRSRIEKTGKSKSLLPVFFSILFSGPEIVSGLFLTIVRKGVNKMTKYLFFKEEKSSNNLIFNFNIFTKGVFHA